MVDHHHDLLIVTFLHNTETKAPHQISQKSSLRLLLLLLCLTAEPFNTDLILTSKKLIFCCHNKS
jgi:hypothetical protein